MIETTLKRYEDALDAIIALDAKDTADVNYRRRFWMAADIARNARAEPRDDDGRTAT